MSKRKPIIAMDISATGKGGGPYTSTMNIINSSLKEKYDYRIFKYDTNLGRNISFKRIKHIAEQLKEIQPDIVHFTGLQLSGFHIVVASKIAKIDKTIVVIRGSSTEAMDISRFKRFLMFFLEAMTLLLSSTFYGVSQYSSKVGAAKLFQNKSNGHIYNLPITTDKTKGELSRDDLKFSNDDIIIVTVGRITKDKGYHILKDSISYVLKETKHTSKVKFLVIGNGAYLEEMKNELSEHIKVDRVSFLGYRDDIKEILPLCDIFVLPTLHETLSNALLEASEFELPLIASNVGGVPEIIKNGENGFLVPPSDSDALKNAILKLAHNKLLREKMGENAKKNLKVNFSEDNIVEKIDCIYQKILNK